MWAILSTTQWSKFDPMNLVVTRIVNKLSAEHNMLTNINVLKILFDLFKSILLREVVRGGPGSALGQFPRAQNSKKGGANFEPPKLGGKSPR